MVEVRRLNPDKLHVEFGPDVTSEGPLVPRRYTLTHSDATGDLYLTVASNYDQSQVSGCYTRLMRDEVLGEWQDGEQGPAIHVHCHVSGGLVLGSAGWRDAIFRRELPLVLEALRHGDRQLYENRPELDRAEVCVHFHARERRYNVAERWGVIGDYC